MTGQGTRGRESALHEVVIAASSLLDPSGLAAVCVRQVRRLLDVDGSTVTFWDDEQQVLVTLSYDDDHRHDPAPVFHRGQGMSGSAFATDAPVVVFDYARELAHPPFWESAVSGLAVPLRGDGVPVGALSAQHYSPRRFTADDVELLELLAAQIGPALATMRTLARAERRTVEAQALAMLMRRATMLNDLDALYTLVCRTAAKLLGADLAGLVLRDVAGRETAWHGVVGNRTDAFRERRYGGDHPAAATIFGGQTAVVRGGGGAVIDPIRFPFFAAEGIRAGIAVPLDGIDETETERGALCVGWRFDVEPPLAQLELAEALAGFSGALVAAAAARTQRDALVGSAPVVIAAMDADGILTLCEGASAAAIGIGPADVGRRVSELLADEPAALARLMDAARLQGPARLHVELRGRAFDAELVVRDGTGMLIATDVTERRAAERELVRRATEDDLTGLPNLAEVVRRIAAALDGAAVSVAVADVRAFDHINESVGYETGDDLLRRLATRLADDLADAIVVGRTGGDEFTIAAHLDSDELGARVRASMEALIELDGGEAMTVDVRCGLAVMPAGGDPQELFRHADAALQLARRGPDVVVEWNDTAAAWRRDQLTLTRHLRRALDHDQIELAYQPIVETGTGILRTVEALARWTTEDGDRISPVVFVSLAERIGRIGRLTARVLDLALTDVAAGHGVPVSVNVSPLDVMHGDLHELVRGRLTALHIEPELLTLELTENAALESGTAEIRELTRLGVGIAVDDFGRGWSSLELLKRLPARQLKLDRSYVARAPTQVTDEAIVSMAVTLGHALGMEVVAEGIEDHGVLGAVTRLGCDLAQGNGVARPMSSVELGAWLARAAESRR